MHFNGGEQVLTPTVVLPSIRKFHLVFGYGSVAGSLDAFDQQLIAMRLLLQKQNKIGHKQRANLAKNMLANLTPLIESVFSKKCIVEQSKNGLQKTLTFHTKAETEHALYSYKISMTIYLQSFLIIYKATLMKNQELLAINSSELRMNVIHKLGRRGGESKENAMVRVDKQTGLILLINQINYSQLLFHSASQLMKEVELRLKELITVSQKMLQPILMEINAVTRKTEEMREHHSEYLEKIKRHIYFSCYDLGLSQKASEYKHPSQEILKKRQKLIKNLLSRQERKEDVLRDGLLYGMIEAKSKVDNREWRKQFQSAFYFQKLLQIPVPKATTPGQNIYIFNDIHFEKPQEISTQDLPNVSNSCLKVMMATGIYLTSHQEKQKEQGKKREHLSKWLLVKGAKNETAKHRNKLHHQKNIVKIFSSAYSGYLLKYYSCSQQNFAFRNCLLMDYNPYNITLLDHLSLRKDSLSIQSKLNLLANISNGLRFLTYYKVVHMDLNLNNILVYDGYLPKIIDFGEAYNREVVDSNPNIPYSPGFTIPYCSPEVFLQKEFTTSQDMFSFGIIIFRTLLNALPFFASDQLIAIYKAKTYGSRFFFSPERLRSVCQEKVCFLLLQMINICMRVQHQARPLPIWSTIILKEILAYIYL